MSASESQDERLERLRLEAGRFPEQPGVYLMRSELKEVIYVGKAKNLKARVKQYFTGGDERFQISFLLDRVQSVEKIVTDSEHHAFLLERDLIAKHKPRYNIRLKDDKAYLSIRLDESAEWPRLELVRKRANDGASYFGPYSFSYELRGLLRAVSRTVPLRSCTDSVFANRQRPCLEYEIKRCCGPCCLPVDREWYGEQVSIARKILEGKIEPLLEELERLMENSSENLEFEDAAEYRDRIAMLQKLRDGQQYISKSEDDRDVFGLYQDEDLAVLSVLLVRRGRIVDSKNFSLSEVALPPEEVISAAVKQFYAIDREIPKEILFPCEIADQEFLSGWLSEKRGTKVELKLPKRGVKFRLLGLAELNAKEHFLSKFEPTRRFEKVATELQKRFQLESAPRRVECIDISHTQGKQIVGSLVCFFDGYPRKAAYKTYNLREGKGQDDYASIQEVVCKRLLRGQEKGDLPDLMVIDGGKGQLEAALAGRQEAGVSVDIVALAKQRVDRSRSSELKLRKSSERVFIAGVPEAIPLALGTPLTRFMQRVRDEAHRFGITRHRQRRAKKSMESLLDSVAGLGPERIKRLLKEYGSLERIGSVRPEDLAKTGRMSITLAEKVLLKIAEEGDK